MNIRYEVDGLIMCDESMSPCSNLLYCDLIQFAFKESFVILLFYVIKLFSHVWLRINTITIAIIQHDNHHTIALPLRIQYHSWNTSNSSHSEVSTILNIYNYTNKIYYIHCQELINDVHLSKTFCYD